MKRAQNEVLLVKGMDVVSFITTPLMKQAILRYGCFFAASDKTYFRIEEPLSVLLSMNLVERIF